MNLVSYGLAPSIDNFSTNSRYAMKSIRSILLEVPTMKRTLSGFDSEQRGILPNYLVGAENQEVLDLLSPQSVLHLASQSPVLLYGGSGVGKTAIALTLATRWLTAVDRKGATISTGGDFARHFASAVEADDMDRFRQRYRECRLLVLDGIHELLGKEGAQEELIHSLEAMDEAQHPVLVTSSKLPGVLRGIKPALSSRLMGGCTLEICPPAAATRAAILKALADQLQAKLSAAEIAQLGEHLPEGTIVPQLRGILNQWLHRQRVSPHAEREDTIQQLIDHQVQSRIPEIADIAKSVAKSMGVRLSDVRGSTRKAQIVRARALAMYLARQMTPISLLQIGSYFGGRDHTTVMHACRKTEMDLQTDTELSRVAEEIRQVLR